jgi:hypothetical protein
MANFSHQHAAEVGVIRDTGVSTGVRRSAALNNQIRQAQAHAKFEAATPHARANGMVR